MSLPCQALPGEGVAQRAAHPDAASRLRAVQLGGERAGQLDREQQVVLLGGGGGDAEGRLPPAEQGNLGELPGQVAEGLPVLLPLEDAA